MASDNFPTQGRSKLCAFTWMWYPEETETGLCNANDVLSEGGPLSGKNKHEYKFDCPWSAQWEIFITRQNKWSPPKTNKEQVCSVCVCVCVCVCECVSMWVYLCGCVFSDVYTICEFSPEKSRNRVRAAWPGARRSSGSGGWADVQGSEGSWGEPASCRGCWRLPDRTPCTSSRPQQQETGALRATLQCWEQHVAHSEFKGAIDLYIKRILQNKFILSWL